MANDPNTYKSPVRTIGNVEDDAATNSTDSWSILSMLKGIYAKLNTGMGLPSGAATAANQTTANTTLSTIDGHVDGLETLVTSSNTKLDQLHTDAIAATPAGSNLIGRAVADASAATGGIASTARLASAANSTNATNVKTTAGRIYSACGKNNAAYDVFLVLYDAATNPPVPGTTTIRKKMVCPAGQAFVYDWPVGLTFASGIGYAFTKLVADADTTVLAAADITAFNLDYV